MLYLHYQLKFRFSENIELQWNKNIKKSMLRTLIFHDNDGEEISSM